MALAIVTGVFCMAAGRARLGFLTNFLARPILTGYLNGIAISIIVGQLGRLFGYQVTSGGLVETLADFVGIDPAHVPTFAASNRSDKAARWPTLRRFTHRPPTALQPGVRRLRQWSRTTRTPGVATLKRQMWRLEPRPAVGPQERRELADYFKADVGLLAEILDRDLSHWSA